MNNEMLGSMNVQKNEEFKRFVYRFVHDTHKAVVDYLLKRLDEMYKDANNVVDHLGLDLTKMSVTAEELKDPEFLKTLRSFVLINVENTIKNIQNIIEEYHDDDYFADLKSNQIMI